MNLIAHNKTQQNYLKCEEYKTKEKFLKEAVKSFFVVPVEKRNELRKEVDKIVDSISLDGCY